MKIDNKFEKGQVQTTEHIIVLSKANGTNRRHVIKHGNLIKGWY